MNFWKWWRCERCEKLNTGKRTDTNRCSDEMDCTLRFRAISINPADRHIATTETIKGNKKMPKTRIWRRGFKSLAIRVKHKIGGRKSKIGAGLMSNSELEKMLSSVRKRDRNKLRRQLIKRGLILPS